MVPIGERILRSRLLRPFVLSAFDRKDRLKTTSTRSFAPLIELAEKSGKTLHKMDLGEPQEIYPQYAQTAHDMAHDTFREKKMGYGSTMGSKILKDAVVEFYAERFGVKIDPEWVVTTMGASESWTHLIPAALEPFDEVLTFDPHYANFDITLGKMGNKFVVPEGDNSYVNVESIRKSLKKNKNIKFIYLCNPDNPTGRMFTKDEILSLYELAEEHDLKIIWDDVYWNYNYNKNEPSSVFDILREASGSMDQNKIASLTLASFDSLSKTAFVPGWRKGWAVIPDPDIRQNFMRSAMERGSTEVINEIASAYVLKELAKDDFKILNEQKELYRRKRDIVHNSLIELKKSNLIHVDDNPPDGGIYVTVELPFNAADFLEWSLTKYDGEIVTFVPLTTDTGSFHTDKSKGRNQIRFCYGMLEENIPKAMEALSLQLASYESFLVS